MERMLSLIDAFIVRNDLEKAHALLKDTRVEFGENILKFKGRDEDVASSV